MPDNLVREDGSKILREDLTYMVRQVFDGIYDTIVSTLPNLGVASGVFKGRLKWLHTRRIR